MTREEYERKIEEDVVWLRNTWVISEDYPVLAPLPEQGEHIVRVLAASASMMLFDGMTMDELVQLQRRLQAQLVAIDAAMEKPASPPPKPISHCQSCVNRFEPAQSRTCHACVASEITGGPSGHVPFDWESAPPCPSCNHAAAKHFYRVSMGRTECAEPDCQCHRKPVEAGCSRCGHSTKVHHYDVRGGWHCENCMCKGPP